MPEHSLAEQMRKRAQAMEQERVSEWDQHWKDLSDYISPRRLRFFTSTGRSDVPNSGKRWNRKIINNTGTTSLRTAASGMHAGITSPARPWFKLRIADEDLNENPAVQAWLHETERRMRAMFSRTNLYNLLPRVYSDLLEYGVASLGEFDHATRVAHFFHYPVGTWAASNNRELTVGHWARWYWATTAQLIGEFGERNVSSTVKEQYDRGNWYEWHRVLHVVIPNDTQLRGSAGSRGMPFMSVYLEATAGGHMRALDKDKTLAVRGFREFPLFVPRWTTEGEDVYGSDCPGMLALGDIKSLQVEERKRAEAEEKMLDPPLQGPTALKGKGVSTIPGDITYVDVADASQGGLRSIYDVNFPIDATLNSIQRTESRIRHAFFADLFLMLTQQDRPQMTAREVAERHEEKLLMLGPVLERVHTELLDPLITRTVAMMGRAGRLPEVPEELADQPLQVEYVSVLAQAQRLVGVGSIERFSGFVGNLAAANPQVMDKVDWDKMVDEYAQATGVPPDTVVPQEQVLQTRRQRAQQQAIAQAAETGKTAAEGAKVLSETETRSDNALTRLLGGLA